MAINLKKVRACPECGSDDIAYNDKRKEILCKSCGLIFTELTPEQEKKYREVSDVI